MNRFLLLTFSFILFGRILLSGSFAQSRERGRGHGHGPGPGRGMKCCNTEPSAAQAEMHARMK